MTNERKKDLAAIRRYPLHENEMWSQPEPLFSRRYLEECYRDFIETNVATINGAANFFAYLLRQVKSEKQIEKELFERFVYGFNADIMFGRWLGVEGWQPYDGPDQWINLQDRNKVESITNLYHEYKKQNP